MKNITILGAGWLGFPLAVALQKAGHTVKASTTSSEKMKSFEDHHLHAFHINLDETESSEKLLSFLQGTDILIITVPPAFRADPNDNYVNKITGLIPFIEQSGIKEVMFTSSTTVYISTSGEVDETTVLEPVSVMDKQIIEVENHLLQNTLFNTCILRLGGLIGEDRHPVYFLAKRDVIEEANEPVNMVHREDIIRYIEAIVKHPVPNEIFNIVAPVMEDKRTFYSKAARELNVTLPPFKDNANPKMRRVIGSKIAKRYDIAYYNLV